MDANHPETVSAISLVETENEAKWKKGRVNFRTEHKPVTHVRPLPADLMDVMLRVPFPLLLICLIFPSAATSMPKQLCGPWGRRRSFPLDWLSLLCSQR